jgi:hypothetical protein
MGRSIRSEHGQHGVTAVFAAFVLSFLCAFLLLAINVGHGYSVRAELQSAGDSTALAAVAQIGGNDIDALRNSLTTARATALSYAGYHQTDSNISVATPDINLGIWHSEDATPWFEFVSNSSAGDTAAPADKVYEINAVQVGAARDAAQAGGPLTVAGGAMLGKSTMDVVTRATAARFGPCQVACAAPLAFAACQIDAGFLPCGTNTLMMSNATEDNVGFTVYSSKQANGPSIQKLLMTGSGKNAKCDPNFCATENLPTAPADIKLQNGNDLTNENSATSVYTSLSCLVGMTVVAGIVDAPCTGTNPQFSGQHSIITWAKITILAVDSAAKTITIRRECGPSDPDAGRCRAVGLLSTRPVLVQ